MRVQCFLLGELYLIVIETPINLYLLTYSYFLVSLQFLNLSQGKNINFVVHLSRGKRHKKYFSLISLVYL